MVLDVELGAAALGLRTGCDLLVLEELGNPSRNDPKADGLHDQIHDPVERLVLMHLWVGRQKRVVSEPEREGDQQHGQEQRVMNGIRRRTPTLGQAALVGLFGVGLLGHGLNIARLIVARCGVCGRANFPAAMPALYAGVSPCKSPVATPIYSIGEKSQSVAGQSNYITRKGFEKLEGELEWLWKDERPRVTEAVSVAAALGDRSENADYIYGKKRLREIDRRIRFLTKRIDELTVVDVGPRKDAERVYFGAWVTIEEETGESQRYRLVGPDEFDAADGRISVDSPVGRALMGQRLGDEVVVRRPKGETVYEILAIDYTHD